MILFQATEVKGTLKEQVFAMKRVLDGLRNKKDQRVKEFSSVQLQIVRLRDEIDGKIALDNNFVPRVDERDLTVTRLVEMRHDLLELQKEKVQNSILLGPWPPKFRTYMVTRP